MTGRSTANLEAARAKSRSIEAELKNWQSEAEVSRLTTARQHLWDLGLTSEEQLQHAKYKAESDQWDIKRVEESLNTRARGRTLAGIGAGKNENHCAVWRTGRAPLCSRRTECCQRAIACSGLPPKLRCCMRFTLPEKFFGQVRRGQNFEVTSPNAPGKNMSRM